jgi:hypothetical protein
MDQVTEIIGQAGEQANFGSHDISMFQTGGEASTAIYREEIWR